MPEKPAPMIITRNGRKFSTTVGFGGVATTVPFAWAMIPSVSEVIPFKCEVIPFVRAVAVAAAAMFNVEVVASSVKEVIVESKKRRVIGATKYLRLGLLNEKDETRHLEQPLVYLSKWHHFTPGIVTTESPISSASCKGSGGDPTSV
jgi:hypothetical protein